MSSYKWFLFFDLDTNGETTVIKIETRSKVVAWNILKSIVKKPDMFYLAEIRDIRECWFEYHTSGETAK